MEDDLILTRTDLAEVLDAYLTKRQQCRIGIDRDSHEREHEFLRIKMREEQRRYERREKMQASAVGAIILAAVGGLVSFLGWVGSLALKSFQP